MPARPAAAAVTDSTRSVGYVHGCNVRSYVRALMRRSAPSTSSCLTTSSSGPSLMSISAITWLSDTGPSAPSNTASTRLATSGGANAWVMKKSWMSRVLHAAQQDGHAAVEGAARPTDLLVVGDGGARRLEVDDEAEVGLVVAHPERGGGDERLDLVALQPAFRFDPGVAVERRRSSGRR